MSKIFLKEILSEMKRKNKMKNKRTRLLKIKAGHSDNMKKITPLVMMSPWGNNTSVCNV